MNEVLVREPMLHVRFEGNSQDVALREVDLGDMSDDRAVRAAAARWFEVPEIKFNSFTVDRNRETGDITLRPQAIFG